MAAGETSAVERAGSNDFTIDKDISDNNGVKAFCGAGVNPYLDVRVLITHPTKTSLVHFVYSGPVINTVEAVARVWPRTAVGRGNAIISLIDTCGSNDRGTTFDGTADVTITGGGIFSNSCIYKNGAVGQSGGKVYTNSASYLKTFYDNCGKTPCMDAYPQKAFDPMIIAISAPDCTKVSNGSNPIPQSGSIQPGNYKNITVNTNDNITMQPGLYCISGDFKITGGSLRALG